MLQYSPGKDELLQNSGFHPPVTFLDFRSVLPATLSSSLASFQTLFLVFSILIKDFVHTLLPYVPPGHTPGRSGVKLEPLCPNFKVILFQTAPSHLYIPCSYIQCRQVYCNIVIFLMLPLDIDPAPETQSPSFLQLDHAGVVHFSLPRLADADGRARALR